LAFPASATLRLLPSIALSFELVCKIYLKMVCRVNDNLFVVQAAYFLGERIFSGNSFVISRLAVGWDWLSSRLLVTGILGKKRKILAGESAKRRGAVMSPFFKCSRSEPYFMGIVEGM